MNYFMRLGGDSGIEYEVFFLFWFSRFVLFIYLCDFIVKRFFKIVIYLVRGIKIVFVFVVLVSIYRDLSLFKFVMDSDN